MNYKIHIIPFSLKALLFTSLFSLFSSRCLYAEESIDRYFMPETPPAIDTTGTPGIGKPILKKQNFMSEATVTPSEIRNKAGFSPFFESGFPVRLGMYQGGFGTLGGNIRYSSPKGFKMEAGSRRSDGEFPYLASENNSFSYGNETLVSESVGLSGAFNAAEDVLAAEKFDWYCANSKLTYYARSNINVSAAVRWERANIKAVENNDFSGADVSVNWQPWSGHTLMASVSPGRNTSFDNLRAYEAFEGMYYYNLRSVILGCGANMFNGSLYPQASLQLLFIPRGKLAVYYEPGAEKLSWAQMYRSMDYVRTNPSLLWPEAEFSLRESLSYYWAENGSMDFEISQKHIRNYVFWDTIAGSWYVSPHNMNKTYVAGYKAKIAYNIRGITPSVSVTHNETDGIPYVPPYFVRAALNYAYGPWLLEGAYEFTSARRYLTTSEQELPSFDTFSVGFKFLINRSVEIFVAGENLSGRKIETQPGLWYSSPVIKSGISMSF